MKPTHLPLRLIGLTLVAILVVFLCLVMNAKDPGQAFTHFFVESVGTAVGWRETLREMTPLLFIGVAVFLALRAGVFNIGADGQFVVGACAGVVVALNVPGVVGILLTMIVGGLAGALWAWPAAWIKAYRGGHEVISTILLNNIAWILTAALVAGPLRNQARQSPTTEIIAANTRLPNLISAGPFHLNIATLLAILVAAGFAWWFRKSIAGYELRLVGANARAAGFAGVDVKQVTMRAMTLSGALCGFAGAIQVLAYDFRFYSGFSPGYGFEGLGVAVLSGASSLALVPSALLFGIIARGTTVVQFLGVPKSISSILLAVLIIVFAAYRYRRAAEVKHA